MVQVLSWVYKSVFVLLEVDTVRIVAPALSQDVAQCVCMLRGKHVAAQVRPLLVVKDYGMVQERSCVCDVLHTMVSEQLVLQDPLVRPRLS